MMIGKRWWLLHLHAHTVTIQLLVHEIGRVRTEIANAEFEARLARWTAIQVETGRVYETYHLPLRKESQPRRRYRSERVTTHEMSVDDWISGRDY